MVALCDENNGNDKLGVWLRLYAFVVLSSVLFPRTPYGAVWSLLHYVEDIQGIGSYDWAKAV